MSWPGALPPDVEGRDLLPPQFELRPRAYVPRPLPPVTLRSAWRNIVLFLLTAISAFCAQGLFSGQLPSGSPVLIVDWNHGLLYAAAVLAIMLAHEFGHYFAGRYYGVDTSLPYFIPFPLGFGTLGAFIRIRAPIPHRKALFDIGVAGPLAGFAVCLPVLILGVLEATWVPLRNAGEGIEYYGEPLLYQWAIALLKGPTPEGMTLGMGPLGFAAWFGLLLTALNLMPVGQLDGGHATHALMPRRAIWVSRLGILACLLMLYRRPTWLLWAILLLVLGRRPHPPTLDEHTPPGRTRFWVGLLTAAVFVVSFTPDTILIAWPDFVAAWRELLGLTSH